MPAESSNSHSGSKIIRAGFSYTLGTYQFIGMFNQMLQQRVKIVLFAIFQVSLYIPSSMDLPQRRSPALESRTFTRLRCNFSGSASSYPVENSRYTAMLLNEEAVLVSLRVSLTGDTITGDLER
jgi:hypothetical protein